MRRLKVGDRIKLSGGYHMEPHWLRDKDHYYATITGSFCNCIEGRAGDGALAVTIEFDEPYEDKKFSSRFGFMLTRHEGQSWLGSGSVSLYLSKDKIQRYTDYERTATVLLESHASYDIGGISSWVRSILNRI